MLRTFFTTAFLLFLSTAINAQWTQINTGLGSQQIKGLGVVGTNVVAVTANQGIFISSNSGNSWQAHPQNSTLPNFNLNGAFSDFSGQGMIVYGQGFIVALEGNMFTVIPIIGVPNNNFTCYTLEEGVGIPESVILGTNGGGVYHANNLSSTNWTEIPGLNNANAKTITGVYVYFDPNDNEYLLVSTRDGAYISPANSLSNLTSFNIGLSGDSRSINAMYGPIILTKLGIFILPEDNGLTVGWQPLYPTGDFRTMIFDIFSDNVYFYGSGVGLRINNQSFFNEDLTGVTGGAIVASAIQYLGPSGGYIFVGTENGGVFRKQFAISSIKDELVINDFKLNQNYPNPFNPSTKISWQSPIGSHTTLKIYDVLGNEVATLVDEYREAGNHEVTLSSKQLAGGNSIASGIYFYKLQVGEFVQTRKMILNK